MFLFSTLKQELKEQQKKSIAQCSAEVTAYASGCHAHTSVHIIILWGYLMVNMVAFGKEMTHIFSLAIEFWNLGSRFIINGKRSKIISLFTCVSVIFFSMFYWHFLEHLGSAARGIIYDIY